jgi:L-asparaginase
VQVRGQEIVVLGTGGTIAGTARDAADNIGYKAGQVGVGDLLRAIPGLKDSVGARVEAEQVAQIDSKDMDFEIWKRLAERCQHHLDRPSVKGVVITHGTDTLEETAWFLHEVLSCSKPVVLTCAMRPASALTPDGPQNLLDAMALAQTADLRGVFAVAAGEIHGARLVQKVHPYRVNAFASGDAGPMGWIEEGRARWAQDRLPAPEEKGRVAMKVIANAAAAPRVEIVLSHAGASGALVDALVRDGVRGVVVACTGNGTIHHALEAALLRAQTAGVRVVRATRCVGGQVLPKPGDLFEDSGGLSPVKARISMMLDLLAAA